MINPRKAPFLIFSTFFQVLINSFNYTLAGGQRIGTALYLEASALNHSCTPNAGFSFQNGNIVIRALEAIETDPTKPLEDQITISYIDLLDCTKSRQSNLMERYYFQCECHRCQNPELELSMYSIRCQGMRCSGRPVYVGVGRRLEDLDVKPCQECGNKPSGKVRKGPLEVVIWALIALSIPFGRASSSWPLVW